jgi:hypothetical protein
VEDKDFNVFDKPIKIFPEPENKDRLFWVAIALWLTHLVAFFYAVDDKFNATMGALICTVTMIVALGLIDSDSK